MTEQALAQTKAGPDPAKTGAVIAACARVAANPGDAETRYRLGAALYRLARFEDGIVALAATIALDPRHQSANLLLAQALVEMERLADAVAPLDRLARLEPGNGNWHANLAAVLGRIGASPRAREALGRAAALSPHDPAIQASYAHMLIEQQRFGEAIKPLKRVAAASPGDWRARYNLGSALLRIGRAGEAATQMLEAAAAPEAPWDVPFNLALALVAAGRADEAVEPTCLAIRRNPDLIKNKNIFYHLRDVAEGTRKQRGLEIAYERAARVFETMSAVAPPPDFAVHRRDTAQALATAAAGVPESPFDAGIRLLLDGRSGQAIGAYVAAFAKGHALPEKYGGIVEAGPDRGHPVWNAMNPFFYVWADGAAVDAKKVQQGWRTNKAVAVDHTDEFLSTYYADWRRRPSAARDELIDLLRSLQPSGCRVMDLGCGFGAFLRFMVTECGIALDGVYGTELLRSRVEASRRLIVMAGPTTRAADGVAVAIAARNIVQSDALAWDADEFRRRHGPIDLVTLFAVASVFDDAQLDALASRISSLGARFILEASPIARWGMNYGRLDASEIFTRHGYRLIRHVMPMEAPTAESAPYIILPAKYWTGRQVSTYARI
jgi:Flp pilus assembly protein TadD/SAM-dependent methyltransferase